MAGAVHSLWMNPLRLFGTVYELPGNCDGRQDRLVCNQVLIMNKTVGGAAVDGAYRIIYCSEEQIPSCFLRLRSVRRKTAEMIRAITAATSRHMAKPRISDFVRSPSLASKIIK